MSLFTSLHWFDNCFCLENQNEYIEKLQSQYQKELDELLDQARKETCAIQDHSDAETAYLKTIIFGQETRAEKELKDGWEYYSRQLYEVDYDVSYRG